MKKLIAFEVCSRFAIFRKPYTTTSSLTYDFPPKTAIIGLISAIMGFENGQNKANYVEKFKKFKVSVEILNPISKKWTTFKNLNTKKNPPSSNILTITELLVNPRYMLYISWEEDYMKKLKELLLNHESYYTPYLGTANNISTLKFVNDFDLEWMEAGKEFTLKSVVPKDGDIFFLPLEGQKYIFDTLPYEIDSDRNFVSNREYVYNPNGGHVKVITQSKDKIFKVDNGKILTFM